MPSGEPLSTRSLAHAWLAAVREGGLSGSAAAALTSADFRLNLPRSLAPFLAGVDLDTPPARFPDVDAALKARLDLPGCEVLKVAYDVFQGDRGGVQAELRLKTVNGDAFGALAAVTFLRSGDKLAAVWVHADTSDIVAALAGD